MFIYGKHFSSMYRGSMVGAGFGAYAVMGYVIANQQPNADRTVYHVELNPGFLAAIFGEGVKEVEKAIEFLCKEDPKSQTPDEKGKRLVHVGAFLYRVVNGAMYAKIRNEEERREQNRLAQERHRKKKALGVKIGPLPGETAAIEHGIEIHEHAHKSGKRGGNDSGRAANKAGEAAGHSGAPGMGKTGDEGGSLVRDGSGGISEREPGLSQQTAQQLGSERSGTGTGDQAGTVDSNRRADKKVGAKGGKRGSGTASAKSGAGNSGIPSAAGGVRSTDDSGSESRQGAGMAEQVASPVPESGFVPLPSSVAEKFVETVVGNSGQSPTTPEEENPQIIDHKEWEQIHGKENEGTANQVSQTGNMVAAPEPYVPGEETPPEADLPDFASPPSARAAESAFSPSLAALAPSLTPEQMNAQLARDRAQGSLPEATQD